MKIKTKRTQFSARQKHIIEKVEAYAKMIIKHEKGISKHSKQAFMFGNIIAVRTDKNCVYFCEYNSKGENHRQAEMSLKEALSENPMQFIVARNNNFS